MTVDNLGYYNRIDAAGKRDMIHALLKDMELKQVCDYGCNTGLMSKGQGLDVDAYDMIEGVKEEKGWRYHLEDITKLRYFKKCDAVLFLSLFHHLLAADKTKAYELFYRLLLSCKYLIFDCGNLSEPGSAWTSWSKFQKTQFKNEKELLDSFGVPYVKHRSWNICGGQRTIVVFKSEDLKFKVVERFRRPLEDYTMQLIKYGATDIRAEPSIQFYKLELPNGTTLFSKLRSTKDREAAELQNIEKVYTAKKFPTKLIVYYGFSEKYGIMFKWTEFDRINRVSSNPPIQKFMEDNFELEDCDFMYFKDKTYMFDFER